ncbi:MAG: SDR family oxidoreductase [Desulfobaccales bacterium]
MDKILVTGANGFIGRQLCRSLSQQGFWVRAAIRQTAIAPADDLHYVAVGDIGPDTDWTEALRGVHLVVHLAGRAHIMRDSASSPMAEYERINTLGTMRLAQMAAAAHVKRFIFLSSVKVNGEETHDQPFVETDRPAPQDFYAMSKWRAEEGLLHIHQQGRLPVVIIRPPLVYGPGVRANFLQLIRWVDSGLPLPLGKIKNKRSLVGLRNLVDFIMICLHKPSAVGEIFLVSDQEDLSTSNLVQRIGGFLGRSTYLIPIPYPIMSIIAQITGKKDAFDKLCRSLQVNIEKASNVLHWKPPFSINEELEQTITWYKNEYKRNSSEAVIN